MTGPRQIVPSGFARRYCTLAMLLIAYAIFALVPTLCLGQVQSFEPVTAFTTRGGSVLAGGPGNEGTAWLSTFLDIKQVTGDRVVLEYDLRGLTTTVSATLNLELTNLDVPDFTTIYMYSFKGNGLANASDYFRTDNFITTFTDNGLASNSIPPYHIPFSFDLTPTFNQAIVDGDDYLGIVLRNTTTEPLYARYRITRFGGFPKLTIGVPEPSSIFIAVVGAMLLSVRRPIRHYRRN